MLSIDEKSQIQALDRTAPILPMRPGLPEKATHDYVRHGTTTLFAALEVATGKVTDACYPRHRNDEFLRFLKQVAKAYPRVKLHIVVRQLRHPQAPERAGLAGQEPADHHALHPDLGLLAEHGRDLLRHHHPPSHPPRHLHLASRTSSPRSRPSSTAGTNAANRSPGPRPPTRSSQASCRDEVTSNVLGSSRELSGWGTTLTHSVMKNESGFVPELLPGGSQLPNCQVFELSSAALGEELNPLAVPIREDLVGDSDPALSPRTPRRTTDQPAPAG